MTPIEIFSATLSFDKHSSFDFWTLAAPVSWALRQADIAIEQIDIGLAGTSMSFETDHGRIVLTGNKAADGAPTVTVCAPVGKHGSRECARQICYQITQRLSTRCEIDSILWQPAFQTVKPAQFKWAALQDVPRWFGASARRSVLPGFGLANA